MMPAAKVCLLLCSAVAACSAIACVLDGDDDALIIPLDVYIDVAAYKLRSSSMISGVACLDRVKGYLFLFSQRLNYHR